MTADSPHAHEIDGRTVALGRIRQWDDRNARFLAAPRAQVLPARTRVMHRCWLPVLDQDDVGACEAFQGVDALAADPLHKPRELTKATANDLGFRWYDAITHQDEFPGAWTYNGTWVPGRNHGDGDDTGTSTLALCRYLKAQGRISRYEWVTGDDVEAVIHHLEAGGADGRGTVVLTGWGWTRSMCRPGPDGRITVTGADIGGHATILRGFDRRKKIVIGRNHWSNTWGKAGEYAISFDDVANRMREGGDQAVIYR